jgi:hypothetical protein
MLRNSLMGRTIGPRGENRAETQASSTAYSLSSSRVMNLLLLIGVLVNLEYVVRIKDIT